MKFSCKVELYSVHYFLYKGIALSLCLSSSKTLIFHKIRYDAVDIYWEVMTSSPYMTEYSRLVKEWFPKIWENSKIYYFHTYPIFKILCTILYDFFLFYEVIILSTSFYQIYTILSQWLMEWVFFSMGPSSGPLNLSRWLMECFLSVGPYSGPL